MRVRLTLAGLLFALSFVTGANAQTVTIGTDVYAGGDGASRVEAAPRSLFAAGPAVRVPSDVGRDAHLAGFSVQSGGTTEGDLYALGGDVILDGPIGGDLTAGGYSLALGSTAAVAGNARLAGGTVKIGAPVQGTLTVTGGAVILDGSVGGDAWITADHLEFGPSATIAGQLHLTAPNDVQVPATVVPTGRLTRAPTLPSPRYGGSENWGPGWMHNPQEWRFPSLLGLSLAALLTFGFLWAAGTAIMAAAPILVEHLRNEARLRPWRAFLFGLVGLCALVGAIPVAAALLIGLPLVPIAVLALILFWTLGYLLGLHVAAQTVIQSVRGSDAVSGFGWNVLGLALGLLVAVLLNFVPLLGWFVNMLLGILGIGAMTLALAERLMPSPVEQPEVLL